MGAADKRPSDTEEGHRLAACRDDGAWRRWGPYVADRQWGTVREDYSAGGDAWRYFPHDQARMRAYRWGEDGLAGWSDDRGLWCLSLALWNGRDPILKERLFGLANGEGNHGEDVKELYYFLDGLPTHAYMRMLYKYPLAAFPYEALIEENRRRGLQDDEFELVDTGVLDAGYFDVVIEYAKADPDDTAMRITATNRGDAPATIDIIPQIVARDVWSWRKGTRRPCLSAEADGSILACHPDMPDMRLLPGEGAVPLFCENESNARALWGGDAPGPFKDGIERLVTRGEAHAVASDGRGTKCGLRHHVTLAAGQSASVRLRFRRADASGGAEAGAVDAIVDARREEADRYYDAVHGAVADPELRLIQRQAYAGLLWSKQFYFYDVRRWLEGDPGEPPPPEARRRGRNADWQHLVAADVISMPDGWEYPWFASWDLCLQAVAFAAIDPDFAKAQLLLLTRSWYMHPNAALPAYEWSFGDANPPLHAHAALRVFEIDRALAATPDWPFLKRVFRKLPMNFTWWANRKDASGRNVFQGGFLGLDNIGIFDRSAPLPVDGELTQSDGTAWMAMYALDLLRIAIVLGEEDPTYQDLAIKFLEHFLLIAKANAEAGGTWDEADGFFYDVLTTSRGENIPIRARTMVGLIPIFAVGVLSRSGTRRAPEFVARLADLLRDRPDLAALVSRWNEPGQDDTMLLSLLRGHRLKLLLRRMLDEAEFLSPYGIRAVSKVYDAAPFHFERDGKSFVLDYEPAESRTGLFGGNSNWRGPVWMPVNYLMIEALRRFHDYYGSDFKIAWPDGSGREDDLDAIADALSQRLVSLFRRGEDGRRPVHGTVARFQDDPHFRDLLLFYEYFDGDNGRGVGASHQTGWTALVATLIGELGRETAVSPPAGT